MNKWINRRASELKAHSRERIQNAKTEEEVEDIIADETYVVNNAVEMASREYQEECEYMRASMIRDMFRKW